MAAAAQLGTAAFPPDRLCAIGRIDWIPYAIGAWGGFSEPVG